MALLDAYLQRLYGTHYPGLTTEMGVLWYQTLRHLAWEDVHQAVTRWAADHRLTQHPTLTDLVRTCEDLQAVQRRQRAADGHHTHPALEGERDDDYSSAEVRALIRSVWPDAYPEPQAPLKDEERAARLARLRQQVAELEGEEGC
jgi:hypothetical protein